MSDPRLWIVGVPMRRGSISGGRFDLAPGAIRDAMDRYVARQGGQPPRLAEIAVEATFAQDLHPVIEMDVEAATAPIEEAVRGTIDGGSADAVLLLGGDNSITRPGARALGPDLSRTGLLTFDAHHDLRDTDDGLTNGNPVRALLQDGLPGSNVVQVGIQPLANSERSASVAAENGVSVISADDVREVGIVEATSEALLRLAELDAIYVDLDVDVLDRVYAPACPGSRPGGLTPAELQRAASMCGEEPRVRALDIVEVDPERDVAEATVMTAASLVLAFAAGMARRKI